MDRTQSAKAISSFAVMGLLSTFLGCIGPNPRSIPTVWDGLGIPKAVATVRDATINRNGNFPKLEKKPPILKLADPANMAPEKPEMIKTAAKIKADQDLKKQKIKALKFLAEVNCGCYNKDQAVAKAFLAALEDCDPDVRMAGIEGLCVAAGNCSKCRNRCEPNCCTEEIYKKVQDIAFGVTETGCCKEPVKEIRVAAAALLKKCPCPPQKALEEIPAPEADSLEEVIGNEAPEKGESGTKEKGESGNAPRRGESTSLTKNSLFRGVSYRISEGESESEDADEPVHVSRRVTEEELRMPITNPDQLIQGRVISSKSQLGEVLIELSDIYQLSNGWTMVVVHPQGHQLARVTETSGRRILLSLEGQAPNMLQSGSNVSIGLVSTR